MEVGRLAIPGSLVQSSHYEHMFLIDLCDTKTSEGIDVHHVCVYTNSTD